MQMPISVVQLMCPKPIERVFFAETRIIILSLAPLTAIQTAAERENIFYAIKRVITIKTSVMGCTACAPR